MKECTIEEISGVPMYPQDFIVHVPELFNFPIKKGDTYLTLFDRLLEDFSKQPEHKDAIQVLVDFNKKEYEGTDTLEGIVREESDESESLYLVLIFRDKQ
jgi:hypothetical protein